MTHPTQPHVYPTFQAHDAEGMLTWLTTTLGFVENAVYRDGGLIAHAQLDWPDGGAVMFGHYRPEREWNREPGTAGVYLVATDVDAAFARAQAADADIVRPLTGTDYGAREFALRDPEGNLWSVGDYPGEPSKA